MQLSIDEADIFCERTNNKDSKYYHIKIKLKDETLI